MRRIDPNRFHVATRGTSRHINRQIALTLIGTHQPISRADLARRMKLRRGAVSLLIQELLAERHIVEGTTGQAARGRKPTLLYINTRQRSSIAVDIRASRTYLVVCDSMGHPRSDIVSMPTARDLKQLVAALAARIRTLLEAPIDAGRVEGVGVVVPGMVDTSTGRVLHAPTLGWRNVDLRDKLGGAIGLPVHIENSGRACALAQMWEGRHVAATPARNLVFVSVSDGVGVGVVVNGELLRGRHHIAGEFAHMPLSIDGPRCSCGAIGCWEAHISNLATLTRYFGRAPHPIENSADHGPSFTVTDLIARARAGDGKASAALQASARYLGLGLGAVVNIINPDCLFIGGEITTAWDLIDDTVRAALAERALTPAAAATTIVVVSAEEHPRLRGAAMLVTAPAFAAPVVA